MSAVPCLPDALLGVRHQPADLIALDVERLRQRVEELEARDGEVAAALGRLIEGLEGLAYGEAPVALRACDDARALLADEARED